jgi:hypothetical protein
MLNSTHVWESTDFVNWGIYYLAEVGYCQYSVGLDAIWDPERGDFRVFCIETCIPS